MMLTEAPPEVPGPMNVWIASMSLFTRTHPRPLVFIGLVDVGEPAEKPTAIQPVEEIDVVNDAVIV